MGTLNSNAPNAMIARLKGLSGPPNAVIAKGGKRGQTSNAIVALENGLTSLFKEVRVFKVCTFVNETSTPPPPRKYYENNSPRIFLCNFGGRLRQNCVITKKLILQELFCVIGYRRDLRLVHVELREIYVTPKKTFLRGFFAQLITRNCRNHPENNSSGIFLRK